MGAPICNLTPKTYYGHLHPAPSAFRCSGVNQLLQPSNIPVDLLLKNPSLSSSPSFLFFLYIRLYKLVL